ncbi:MAG: dapB [Bacillota bacterium]|jgi:4-hydroxy-tetrahydrodipicolinate reductase|nr:dapB [Bacillota bacterium]
MEKDRQETLKIGLVGYGRMGRLVKETIEKTGGVECAGIVSPEYNSDLSQIDGKLDVIIDFSHPSNLDMIASSAEKNHTPVVFATTGYSAEQIEEIKELSQKVAVVYTANFSLGITVFQQVLRQITPVLRDVFDIEIIEKHHKMKLDSPSGTAKMLLQAVEEGREYEKKYGREGFGKRGDEIGIHSVRGGTIAGEHTVLFAGEDEILEITHQAHSRQIFATGAVQAAKFAAGKNPDLYDMNDVLFKKEVTE